MANKPKHRWGRHFNDAEIAEAREGGRLLAMELETSHRCNLRCVYCYNRSGREKRNELTLGEILDAVDQGVDLGARRVVVIGGGEPLMHPEIMRILEYLRERDLGIDLFTNGTLITADLAQRLFDLGVEPVVKFNSLNPEIQDMLCDYPGAQARIMEGIDHLLAAGYPTEGRELGLESIICSYNYHEMPQMWRWARDRNLVPYFEMITFQGRSRNRRDLNVPVERLRDLFEELARLDREHYGLEWTPRPPIAALQCRRHEYSCTVDARGYVKPCPGVDIKVGNIRYQSLSEILAGSVVIQALRNVRDNIKGACRDCDLTEECYGCRGMAYHLTGDFMAADPLCWRNPEHLSFRNRDTPVELQKEEDAP